MKQTRVIGMAGVISTVLGMTVTIANLGEEIIGYQLWIFIVAVYC